MKHLTALPPPLRLFAEPFEVILAVSCLVTGVPALLGHARPQSLVVQSTPWLLHGWGALLCLGGVATLAARWRIGRPQTDLGYRSAQNLEVVGLLALSTAIGIYAIAILAVGLVALAAGSITAAMSASFAMRAWIVLREIKAQRRAAADG